MDWFHTLLLVGFGLAYIFFVYILLPLLAVGLVGGAIALFAYMVRADLGNFSHAYHPDKTSR